MFAPNALTRLARLYNIQSSYRDGLGQLRHASTDAILQVLRALGAPLQRLDDADDAWRQRRQALWQRVIEPVIVVWQTQPAILKIRVPRQLAEAAISYRILFDSGATIAGELRDDPATQPVTREVEGLHYVTRRLIGPAQLPLGYHRLYLRISEFEVDSYLFCAPPQAYTPAANNKRWGVFCPLYALHSEQGWGAGDFSDLSRLVEFTASHGGHAVATLPMLASLLDEPFNPSPYAPVSRLFWNEFYLDIERIAELQDCAEAKTFLTTSSLITDLNHWRAAPLVQYREVMARKREILTALLRALLQSSAQRRNDFENFIASHPVAQDYAEFRAKTEREQKIWIDWPMDSREGKLQRADFDDFAKLYHLYVQWQCAEQIAAVGANARRSGAALYLDFPLGVNRDGYDVWRERNLFALGMNGGAPPDGLFVKGQNWGFPPLHPEAIRQQGYRYYIDCLRHHMGPAGMLRIDHVMGLHRVFWVPDGFSATDGVYVHYRAPEFYAILNLESHRHQVQIVGENLGTVPDFVNATMARRKIFGMHVGQFAVNADPNYALDPVPAIVVASLNTHDTATFMGFWLEHDIDDRVALGLLDSKQADHERRYRATQRDALIAYLRAKGYIGEENSAATVLRGWLTFLAGQDAEFILINLEDLWLEPAPQNVPGTWQERPNWRRKTRHSFEEVRGQAAVNDLLKTISDIRARMV
jgi:4-alpha-glucanotransferase